MKKFVLSTILILSLVALLVLATQATNSPTACNGQWTSCSNAFGDNVNRATATATSSANKSGIWNNYGFTLLDSATIQNVTLRTDFFSSRTSGFINVRVSTDGGATYSPSHIVGGNTAEQTFTIDVTSDFAWTGSKLNNSNLKINVTCFKQGGGTNPECRLDWVPVNVTYTPFDYTVSSSPNSASAAQNTTAQTTVSVIKTAGGSGTVSLTSSGCPTGATCSFSPGSGNPSYNSTFSVALSPTTPTGLYQINITGTGEGLSRVTVFNVTVTDSLPIADASGTPLTGSEPLNVDFTGSVSGGNSPFSYLWNFTDGSTSTSQNPSHTFNNAGTYNVSFKVTDNDGDSSTDYVLITVNSNPAFDFSISASPNSLTVHQTESTQTTATVTLVSGTTQTVTLTSGCITGAICSFNTSSGSPTYNALLTVSTSSSTPAGGYVITVNASNGSVTKQTSFNVTVTDSLPVADALASPTSGNEPLNVQFNASVSGGDAPLTYLWNFADGSNSTSQNPTHSFNVGTYNVSLTVTDSDGDISADTVLITVSSNAAFDFSISASPNNGSVAQNRSTTSTVLVGLLSGSSQNVDLGVAGCPSGAICSLNVSSGNPTYNSLLTLSAGVTTPTGTYQVNVTGTNGTLTKKTTYTFTVTDSQPIALASSNIANGTAPLNVSFTGSWIGGNSPFTTLWDFNDSTTSSQASVNHTFSSAGTYNVKFTVTDYDGDTSTNSSLVITVN